MNDNHSVRMIEGPEFIDVHPFNPNISQCQIKVLYVGKNRNGSYIDKEMATQLADSLGGCPIVGCYRDELEDFGDHGEVITIEDGEVKFGVKTKPYGFIAPDAKVWFQKYADTNEFNETIEREYLVTEGYLWTGQYEEAQQVIDEGKGQSMELDGVDGHWATEDKTGVDFFIIDDAVFSKLCILGDDVEPCFEGASITAPDQAFSADENFAHSLFTMMGELKDALTGEGRLNMAKDAEKELVVDEPVEAPEVEETVELVEDETAESIEDETAAADPVEEVTEPEDEPVEDESVEDEPVEEPFSKSERDSLLAELADLRQYKAEHVAAEKDALIDKYDMLSVEDKADVIEHKAEYSLEQIDEKLALVYVRKNVDFEKDEKAAPELDASLTFNLDDVSFAGSAGGVEDEGILNVLRNYKSF